MLRLSRLISGLAICAGLASGTGNLRAADVPLLPKMPDSTPPGKPHFDSTGVQVGEQLPDLPVFTIQGNETTLRHALGPRPTLLLTSSYTCPQSRSRYPSAAALAARMKDDIATVFVYVIEAHPKGDPSPYSGVEDVTIENQRDHVFCAQPQSLGERMDLAKQFQRRLEIKEEILVDLMINAVWKSLGSGPNMGFLIDENGIVLARQGWFDAASMETATKVFRAGLSTTDRQKMGQPFSYDLIVPTEKGDLAAVKSQLAKSPELARNILFYEGRGDEGARTLLHYAVEYQQLPIVELLVSKGADVNLQTAHSPSPLHLAAKNGDLQIAKFLLDHSAAVNARGMDRGPTPLQEALINSKADVAQLLVASGATTNFFTEVAMGNFQAVEKRIASDSTISVRPDGWGRPPLAYAAACGQQQIAKALLAAGARDIKPNLYNNDECAIWWAVHHQNIAMIRLLCQAESNPNLLDQAIFDGSTAVVAELLAQKADPEFEDQGGYHPLHNAAVFDRVEIIRLLLDAHADPNAVTGYDRRPCAPPMVERFTPLHLAARRGSAQAVIELLKHGAKIDVRDGHGNTPLLSAVGSYEPPMKVLGAVRALVDGGAEVNARLGETETVLDVALKAARTADKPDSSVVDLLRARGAKAGS